MADADSADESGAGERGGKAAATRPDTLPAALRHAAAELQRAGIASPLYDARLIAAHLLGCAPLDTMFYDDVPDGFWAAVDRRLTREPLQHILGQAPFGPLDIKVGPGVFIPRPETESLADWGARQAQAVAGKSAAAPLVADLCSGSGAVAAYIAHAAPAARVVAVELSADALPYTRHNAEPHGVEVVHGDATDPTLLEELHGQVDVVVANPPYVPESSDLPPEVYADPDMAVFSGADGMRLIRGMVPVIATLLGPGGAAAVEHDDTSSEAVQDCFAAAGQFTDIAPLPDLTGVDRFVTARKLERRLGTDI